MLGVTNLPSLIKDSEEQLWPGRAFSINKGKIIAPEISLPIKARYIFVLSF